MEKGTNLSTTVCYLSFLLTQAGENKLGREVGESSSRGHTPDKEGPIRIPGGYKILLHLDSSVLGNSKTPL